VPTSSIRPRESVSSAIPRESQSSGVGCLPAHGCRRDEFMDESAQHVTSLGSKTLPKDWAESCLKKPHILRAFLLIPDPCSCAIDGSVGPPLIGDRLIDAFPARRDSP